MTALGHWESPLGTVILAGNESALTGLWFEGQKHACAGIPEGTPIREELPVFAETRAWLAAYFAGRPLPFLPPLAPEGTEFRKAVWRELCRISYGKTVTYGEIAAALKQQGRGGSPRAVGNAVGHNPISILIPCHRVLGSGGALTGYAGGISRKEFLLRLEGIGR